MLQIKNRAMLDQWKMLNIVKDWSTIEANERSEPIMEETDTESWLRHMLVRLVDRSVDMSEKRLRPFNVLLGELKTKASSLYDEWSKIKVISLIYFFKQQNIEVVTI